MVSKCGYRYGKNAAGERVWGVFVWDQNVSLETRVCVCGNCVLCLSWPAIVELIVSRRDGWTAHWSCRCHVRRQQKNIPILLETLLWPTQTSWEKIRNWSWRLRFKWTFCVYSRFIHTLFCFFPGIRQARKDTRPSPNNTTDERR